MYYELQNRSINDFVQQSDIRVIHLVRENKLERIASSILANKRGSWHSETNTVNNDRITIDTTRLIAQIENQINEDQVWENRLSNKNYLRVTYEQFSASAKEVAKSIFLFLDVPTADVSTPLKKVSGSLSQSLHNYTEEEKVLQNTPYIKYLQSE